MNPLREVWLKIHNVFHNDEGVCGNHECSACVYLPVYRHIDAQIGAEVREAFQLAADQMGLK